MLKDADQSQKVSSQQIFLPTCFFDLTLFAHKVLFENCLFVWDALSKIDTYIKRYSMGNKAGSISPQAYLVNPELITIGEGTVVEPGAYIKGPCIIGDHCIVRHGAYIRGSFVCGDHCVIGHDTEVKQSIFLNSVHAAHFAYLGDSILGNDVNLGAGTKCANLRLDQQNIKIVHEGSLIDTGLRKFGAVMGDRAQTGCNSVTNPGTIIGRDTVCYPNTTVNGYIPANHSVRQNIQNIIKENRGKLSDQ